ncbi:MAG TPA: SAM-dependent methyltransferase [Dongiaceae bacterium]|nr:SAM-dependent methyltransferase [Dongiaceae bacterium]
MHAGASDALTRLLVAGIEAGGPIPFARFMEAALYHPEHGYYTRGLGGGGGRDYATSSGLSRVYGAMLARQAAEMWHRLGEPDRFRFVEFGPGEGTFACDFLRAAAETPRFARALEYLLIETSPALAARQAERLARHAPSSAAGAEAWRHLTLESLEAEAPIEGCLFANEVLDAFPAHRIVGTPDGPLEVHVDAQGGALVERLLPIAEAATRDDLAARGLRPEPGQTIDIQPAAGRFVTRAARCLGRGWFVVVDYGYEAADLFHPARRRGTLMAYHRHRAGEAFLERPGEQDLTAHVDFTAVARAAAAGGLALAGMSSQARFLLALGALDQYESSDLREREAIKDLVLPDRMGGVFRVMILASRGLETGLRGLGPVTPPAPSQQLPGSPGRADRAVGIA